MVYTNKKTTALGLRKEGWSYSEIMARVPVSKASLSKWFREIKLSPVQRSRLKQKRLEAARRGSDKKREKTSRAIDEIRNSSAKEIGKISKRELWLMGAMLYWKNGNQKDLKKGVHFSSSDPDQIKLFLKWLAEIGGLKDEELEFDIFIKKNNDQEETVSYWSEITGFSKDSFSHIYRYKKGKGRALLRVRVRASSMLARQINGWIQGLKETTKP